MLRISVQPPIVDQSFRFFYPELSYIKKLIRIPSPPQTEFKLNHQPMTQIWTRISDPEILAISNRVCPGEMIDLLVKISLDKSPQVRQKKIFTDQKNCFCII